MRIAVCIKAAVIEMFSPSNCQKVNYKSCFQEAIYDLTDPDKYIPLNYI